MFIHLGGDVVVSKDEVIAILNIQLMKRNEVNRDFMKLAENDGFINTVSEKASEKSVIITTKKIYLSPISSVTLKKRSDDLLDNVDTVAGEEPW